MRLAICRGSEEKNNQPHCFNLSRGEMQRFRKTVYCGFARCRRYETTRRRRPEEVAGVEREALRWELRFRYRYRFW